MSARVQIAEDETILRRVIFPELRRQCLEREAEILEAVLRTPPAEAAPLVEELRDLLETHAESAGMAGLRDAAWLPRPDRVGLVEVLQAAIENTSLLGPAPPDPREPRTILRRPEGGFPAQQVENRYPVRAGHRLAGPGRSRSGGPRSAGVP